MRTDREESAAEANLDKRRLQALGVLLPIQFRTLSFLPGRHPLGRAGEGMRFLRTREFEPGEDNPRDIDKFSPAGESWVNEWEWEAQASMLVLGDFSPSMAFGSKAAVRNLTLLQLTYSLWRACDRVRTILYERNSREEFRERNLRSQLEKLTQRLADGGWGAGNDAIEVLREIASVEAGGMDDVTFIVSDFGSVDTSRRSASVSEWCSLLRKVSSDIVPVIVTFELNASLQGSIKLWDPARQSQRLTLLSPSRVGRINRQERLRVQELQRFFRELGLNYLLLTSERDVYSQLSSLARMRRRRAA